MRKLPHRAQVGSTFWNGNPLKMRQKAIRNIRRNTNLKRSKRSRKPHEFLKFGFQEKEKCAEAAYIFAHLTS